jgi:hypothetical protein
MGVSGLFSYFLMQSLLAFDIPYIVIDCKTGTGGDLTDVMWSYHVAPGDALYIVLHLSAVVSFSYVYEKLFFFSRTQLLFRSECCLTPNEQFIYDGKTFLP